MKLGSQKRELLHMRHWLSHRSQQEEMYLTSVAKVTLLYDPQQEEERFSLCLETAQPMKIYK